MSVDLPAPLGPTIAHSLPDGTDTSNDSSTRLLLIFTDTLSKVSEMCAFVINYSPRVNPSLIAATFAFIMPTYVPAGSSSAPSESE
jgi:hypothetical protein